MALPFRRPLGSPRQAFVTTSAATRAKSRKIIWKKRLECANLASPLSKSLLTEG
jgi:hypothetical protein